MSLRRGRQHRRDSVRVSVDLEVRLVRLLARRALVVPVDLALALEADQEGSEDAAEGSSVEGEAAARCRDPRLQLRRLCSGCIAVSTSCELASGSNLRAPAVRRDVRRPSAHPWCVRPSAHHVLRQLRR